jgi:hypothetical protein
MTRFQGLFDGRTLPSPNRSPKPCLAGLSNHDLLQKVTQYADITNRPSLTPAAFRGSLPSHPSPAPSEPAGRVSRRRAAILAPNAGERTGARPCPNRSGHSDRSFLWRARPISITSSSIDVPVPSVSGDEPGGGGFSQTRTTCVRRVKSVMPCCSYIRKRARVFAGLAGP